MTRFEAGLAVLFALGGIRSLVYWARRPFDSTDVTDQLLYALFRTARIGLWFAFAGLFLIYATSEESSLGRQADRFRWYLLILLGLSALQFVAGQLLGRRTPSD
ncbi:MAG: hypothetical protein WD206_04025 [Actinomycetota bacterium]